MNLEPYGWAVGISDILQWRDCPERFVFGMKRHTEGARARVVVTAERLRLGHPRLHPHGQQGRHPS
jgi:hypothetical protein